MNKPRVSHRFITMWAERFPAILTTKRGTELLTTLLRDAGVEVDAKEEIVDYEEK